MSKVLMLEICAKNTSKKKKKKKSSRFGPHQFRSHFKKTVLQKPCQQQLAHVHKL